MLELPAVMSLSKKGFLTWKNISVLLMHENETRIFIVNPRRHTGQIKVTARIRVLRGKTKPKGFLQLLAGGKEELQLAERVTRGFAAFAKTTKANSFHYLPHTSLCNQLESSALMPVSHVAQQAESSPPLELQTSGIHFYLSPAGS